MEFAHYTHPLRAVVRCKAKQQLLHLQIENRETPEPLDEDLLKEITATFFQSQECQNLYQACHSEQAAVVIEDRIATELATIYRRLKRQEQDPMIQHLNSLLSE